MLYNICLQSVISLYQNYIKGMINLKIKTIEEKDFITVKNLITDAFTHDEHGYNDEAELVAKIRNTKEYIPELEVVAEDEGILGYALLSEVYLNSAHQQYTGLVLAPIAVNPDSQKSGVGKLLMNELEKRAKALDYEFISILGHPEYYTKFGYKPASKYNILSPFKDVPDETFMIKEIKDDYLKDKEGTIQYSEAFN